MIERLLSFADPSSNGYGAIALGDSGAAAWCVSGDSELRLDDAEASRGDGSLRLTTPAATLVLGIAAHSDPLGFETAAGTAVGLQAVGVSGELPGGGDLEGQGVVWSFGQDDDDATLLRSLWAMGADRSLFVLFATGTNGSAGHASERLGAARIARDGGTTGFAEPLLSTEYDGAGSHRRATLELWPEEGMAERGAGRRESGGMATLGGSGLAAARFAWSMGGTPAVGGYEIVRG